MTPALPPGARVFLLQRGSKEPRKGSRAHHDAKPTGEVDLTLVPEHYNYGIALDGQWLLLDIDDPEKFQSVTSSFSLPHEWRQKTRRGYHILFSFEDGHLYKNTKIPGADLKVRGLLVGPGSIVDGYEYVLERDEPPQPPPQWLVDMLHPRITQEASGIEVGGVPAGSHDEFLHRLASWARGQYGLSEDALRVLVQGALPALSDTNPEDPYGPDDVERIARSAAGYDAGGSAEAATMRSGDQVAEIPPRQDDILPGFIPRNALTILYGDGKIGKSSFLSWLAARETRAGRGVVFIPSGEEPFDLFVMRARRNGAVDRLLYEFDPRGSLLPTGLGTLERHLDAVGGVSLVLVDALYSHFGPSASGENEAVRARSRLSLLAASSARLGYSVLGTIHENAGGGLLGSREMRNVARSLLHAKGGRGKDFTVYGEGRNGWAPDYGIAFRGHAEPVLDENGSQIEFVDLFGEKVAQSIWVLEDPTKVVRGVEEVPVELLEPSTEDRIKDLLMEEPGLTNTEIADALGLGVDRIKHVAPKVRNSLGIEKRGTALRVGVV